MSSPSATEPARRQRSQLFEGFRGRLFGGSGASNVRQSQSQPDTRTAPQDWQVHNPSTLDRRPSEVIYCTWIVQWLQCRCLCMLCLHAFLTVAARFTRQLDPMKQFAHPGISVVDQAQASSSRAHAAELEEEHLRLALALSAAEALDALPPDAGAPLCIPRNTCARCIPVFGTRCA